MKVDYGQLPRQALATIDEFEAAPEVEMFPTAYDSAEERSV